MTSPLTLTPIDVSSGTQTNGGCAAFTGASINYFYPDGSNNVTIASLSVERYLSTRAAADLKGWQLQRLAKMFGAGNALSFASNYDTTLAVIDQWIYLFWIDTKNQTVGAARCGLDGGLTSFAQVATTQSGVTTPLSNISGITAMTTPDGMSVVLIATSVEDSTLSVRSFTLSPNSLSTSQHLWPASTVTAVIVPGGLDSTYWRVSATWFNQGATATPSRTQAGFNAVLALFSRKRQDARTFFFPIDASGSQIADVELVEIQGISNDSHKNSVGRGITLSTDPGGRVVAVHAENYTDSSGNADGSKAKITTRTLATFQPLSSASAWSSATRVLDANGNPVTTGSTPFIAYIAGSAVEANNVQFSANEPARDCLVQSIVSFVFGNDYDGENSPRLLPYYWGQLIEVPNYASSTPKTPGQLAATLVADAFPVPIPTTDIWDNTSPDGMGNWEVCSYQYLTSQSSSQELAIENTGVVGVKSGITTTAGLGPQMESSVRRGVLEGFSSIIADTTTSAVTIASKAHKAPDADAASYVMNTTGVLNTQSYPGVTENVFVFQDASGATVTGVSAPIAATIVPTRSSSGDGGSLNSLAFQTYVATPGQITSYLPANINARMAEKFQGLSQADQQKFIIDGEDFRALYSADPDNGYVQRVIQRFATPLNSNGNLFLEFAFSPNGTASTQFQLTESFRSTGGLFFDSMFYAGVGGGVEFNVFGVGFAMSAYAMVGIEFQSSISSANATDASWGIELTNYLNILDVNQSYTSRLYLLQPSKLWSLEVQMFSTLSAIDDPTLVDLANSAPIRIMFTVPVSEGLA